MGLGEETKRLLELGFRLGAANKITSPKPIENKWAERWKREKVFWARLDESKPKYFICVPYSYQNGPLHLGHGFTFTRGDVIARYKRMAGFNVLFPWAWHWTGEAVAGTSERLQKGDEAVKRMLVEIDGVPEELLHYFTHPEFICAYYTAENRQVVNVMGWSVDWSREFYTTDLHPYYSNFIKWQYETLRRNGLLVQGRHPVVWCPKCQSATGDHDRLRGEGIYPEEYTLVFFTLEDLKLAAATLRPETIYGATNVWINPEGAYSIVEKNGVKLVMSREAVEKLTEQFPDMKKIGKISAGELLGKFVKAPLTNESLPILPAEFVDVSLGTGVVYSVPAHAPYDYAALKELQKNPTKLLERGLNPELVGKLSPIKVIETQGFGDHPAVEVVEKNRIDSQLDERLEELTREIYSKEFYSGVMAVGEFKGLRVSDARQLVIEKLRMTGNGDVYYDLAGKVVCRSGDECVVKIVEDQWFLNFSNPEWKHKVKNHLERMNIHPEPVRTWFHNVVDWLHDWACTRKTGLGTNLPWDPSWKIETLSDSTIYPALYTISNILNAHDGSSSKLTVDVFDYVFLGRGDKHVVAAASGIDVDLLDSMRREFSYWYGVDMRVSAKDLVPNHLTFYLFHHTGIFEEKNWPKGISVNGMITIEGEKMSKSRGNFVTLKKAISKHGSDATRLALLLSAEDLDDPDWREKSAVEAEQFIQNLLGIVERVVAEAVDEHGPADDWLLAATDKSFVFVSQMLEKVKTRSACSEAVYGMLNNWRWYLRRNGGKITKAGKAFVERWILMLSPFAPFAAEEAWEKLGRKGYACLQTWPTISLNENKLQALLYEEVLKDLVSDVREVLKVVKGKPVELKLFAASEWKKEVAYAFLEMTPAYDTKALKRDRPELFTKGPALLPKIAEKLREIEEKAKSMQTNNINTRQMLKDILAREHDLILDCLALVDQEMKIAAKLYREEEALSEREVAKARLSIPLKPAIYVVTG